MAAKGIRYHQRIFRGLRQHHELTVEIEPWLICVDDGCLRQPDAVVLFPAHECAIVIEVKLNWRQGRDQKLRHVYLEAVRCAFGLKHVFPLMIVSCVRGRDRSSSRTLKEALQAALSWRASQPIPVMLWP